MRVGFLAVPVAGLAAVLAGLLVFGNLNGNLIYYLTPTEAVAQRADLGARRFRLAGQVAAGSVTSTAEGVAFTMTDGATEVAVAHRGAPPQLFREGIQVVVEGTWQGRRVVSDTVMVKHDETYYPPKDTRKAAG